MKKKVKIPIFKNVDEDDFIKQISKPMKNLGTKIKYSSIQERIKMLHHMKLIRKKEYD